jgi:tRNA-specific 2-thiouridylase
MTIVDRTLPTRRTRIVAAMSGGVDSSVAAALLHEEGHDVVGVSMQLYDQRDGGHEYGSCCSLEDLYDARRVASAVGFPHYIMNFERQFDDQVVSNFVAEYERGRTPIPCARCNSDLKFSALLERAQALGSELVATGHYAQVGRDEAGGRWVLKRGTDDQKDQSYFLWALTQDQLSRAVFPIGGLSKQAVREFARERGLPVANKPESQEICFIPDGDYAAFVARRASESIQDGPLVAQDGRLLGRHPGIHHFTVGQRKGLGLSSSTALHVLEIRPEDRAVVVGPRSALERRRLTAGGVNWIACERLKGSLRVSAQIRHRHTPAAGLIHAVDDGHVAMEFDSPQAAITPGQAVVFYDGEVVVGGGWIEGSS